MPAELEGVEIYVCWTQQGTARAGSAHAKRARLVFIAIASLFAVRDEDRRRTGSIRPERGLLVPHTFSESYFFHAARRWGYCDPGSTFFFFFSFTQGYGERGETFVKEEGDVLGTASHCDGILRVLILDAGRWIPVSKRSPSDMPLYSALLFLFFSFFGSRLIVGCAKRWAEEGRWMDGEGGMHRRREGGSRWEEGEPRERDSAACRKEAPAYVAMPRWRPFRGTVVPSP
ncbi:hypothetical protein DFH08DRAFT_487077 [Mycena albidolilacea]|uniref:Uncharacterized protein n=1 Tax=Mycena albidolilacea TaxID=1033008 RepID=A0AAD6Z667_9AGAR|nr:hypothetical protein DFH08DRAFT_487077 [Mycena albidolilacea]